MEGIANFISMLDYVLDTKRKTSHHRRIAVEWRFTLWRSGYDCHEHPR